MKRNSYSRSELAALYLPDFTPRAAIRQINNWMGVHPWLKKRLLEAGADDHTRFYTPRQVEIIFEALGEPPEWEDE
jgi:hypothetical protein